MCVQCDKCKDRLITGYFRVKSNQPSPSFLSCKLETKKLKSCSANA